MKHAIALLATLCTACLCAQTPEVEWLRFAGRFSFAHRHQSAVDATGHVYVLGHGVGADYGGGTTVAGEGYNLARYDSTGTLLWVRPITGTQTANVQCLATTSTGEVWVGGGFIGELNIDGFTGVNQGSQSSFIARFDTNGEAQQMFSWGGINNTVAFLKDIWVDAEDRVYVAGSSDSEFLTIGGITLSNTAGGQQMLALAFDANGCLWGNLTDSPSGSPRAECITTDAAGNTYLIGQVIDDVVIGGTTLATGGLDLAILTKYDNTGALVHAETLGLFMPTDIAVDDAGQVYISAFFEMPITLAGITMEPYTGSGLVAAFPGDGSCAWAVPVGGEEGGGVCNSVVLNTARTRLLVGGTFFDDVWFGPLQVESSEDPLAAFVMEMDTDGTVNGVKELSGNGPTWYAMATYGVADRIHASGLTMSDASFAGETVLNATTGSSTTFIARFDALDTGVPNIAATNAHLPYPNPCDGTFNLELPVGAHSVEITDARGRLLQRTGPINAQRATFQLNATGVLFVRVTTDRGNEVTRVVVE
jgi:hypothetical protein